MYKNMRIKEDAYKELKKFKRIYELQDSKDYTLSDTILLLIRDRGNKQFILPITNNKKEL